MKVTMGRRGPSPSKADGVSPRPDLVSHESCLSRVGVPVGVLVALSMRLCLEPDLGVTLVCRKAATGEATSSLLLFAPPVLSTDSALWARFGRGVVTVTVRGCGAGDLTVAIFGVRGALFVTPLAAAALKGGIWGCRACVADPFSGGIFGAVLVTDMDVLVFRRRGARATTFLSRGRSAGRANAGAETLPESDDGAAAGEVVLRLVLAAVAVAVIRDSFALPP